MTIYRSSTHPAPPPKAGAHRRITRWEKVVDFFRVMVFAAEGRR
jgi:hypothetical protein